MSPSSTRVALAAALLSSAVWSGRAVAATSAPISGEIQQITLQNPADPWSGGTIVVGGQIVIVPRNLLIDLPANRLTLQQLFAEAPTSCALAGESGLAKGDACNISGTGAIATIAANRTNGGNVIAGDVFIQKGIEVVTGPVTFIDYDDGYFRVNGTAGDPLSGVMVRLNDPDSRHTVQQGLGCATGSPNCSPDPRFTLDADNYTNVFSTGYPLCIPSTVARPFTDVLGLGATTAQAQPDGTGDVLCPHTNRTLNNGQPVDDSRRFAPVRLGDTISAEGNFESVNGVYFLSAHSTMVAKALTTKNLPGQPDYLFLDEVEVDVAGFQNERARTLIIGYTTLAPTDVLIWSLHYDPATNAAHEFPLASSLGCDAAAGPGTCSAQGLVGPGANIFKIRHDVDFLLAQLNGGPALPRLSPCAHLRADPRFATLDICPSARADGTSTLAEELGILTPAPREIQARTGHELANAATLVTVDVNGQAATHGQYLFPFGMGLGGIATPEFNEINLDGLATPFIFSGLPWALDRRLGPGGCGAEGCPATPQPLDPFPFDGLDPRTQAALPNGPYADLNYTAQPLTRAADRVLSFVDPLLGKFNGDATVLSWPPVDPAAQPVGPTPTIALACTATTTTPTPPPPPPPGDGTIIIIPISNSTPVATSDAATIRVNTTATIAVLANDFDPDGDPLTLVSVSQPANGRAAVVGSSVTYTPNQGFTATDTFSYIIEDGRGGSATGLVTISMRPPETLTVARSEFRISTAEWRIEGTSTVPGATVTIHLGPTLAGQVLATVQADALGAWRFRQAGSSIQPDATRTVSLDSNEGATLLNVPVAVRQ